MNIEQLRKEMVIRMLSGVEQQRTWLEIADDCLNIPIGGEVKKKCCNGSSVCKGEGFTICPRLLKDCVEDER